MKKLITTVCVLICAIQFTFAQLNVTTDYRQEYSYNTDKKEYEELGKGRADATFFEFNKDFTMFKHVTTTITSSYTIKSTAKDTVANHYEFEVMSDVGNHYLMILDLKNESMRFIYTLDDVIYMVRHRIKKAWFVE